MAQYTNTAVVKNGDGQVIGAMMLACPVDAGRRDAFAALVTEAVAAYEALGPTEAERRRIRSRTLTEYFS